MEGRTSISEHFGSLTDPRVERTKLHRLMDIILIAVCAVISGADDWVDIEEYGEAKLEWLRGFLELPHGIPSHDTFGRVFSMIDPEQFGKCFLSWARAASQAISGQVVAIDGKSLRGSRDQANGRAAIHMVSAWATECRMVLGQVRTEDKSNEITAIPELIELLALKGCIVTIDAMGCQKEIASKLIGKGADYVLSLKGNQGTMHEEVRLFFEDAMDKGFGEFRAHYHESVDGDHGRVEVRRCWAVSQIEWLPEKAKWVGLKSIAMVESQRHIGSKVTTETRYFLSSLPGDAKRIAEAVRAHWAVENSLHWSLDVSFREDECRVRKDHAPQNLSVLRHMALSLLKNEKTCKRGVKAKRLRAGWDLDYLAKVLNVKTF